MPSTTRGSILISTANDIGEALVEKLGGVGYSPNEWKDKFNLCGIAPIDSAPALSVLSDSAGTGDARGSILIATADAIGAILNKKYNVLRGFKPKEWASACRKMKALEEGSVASASVASFSDGADTVPLTSCVCSIDANLDGKTAVNAVHAGVNIWNEQWEVGGLNTSTGADSTQTDRIRNVGYISVKPNTQYYFYNGTDIASQSNINIVVCCYDQNKQYTGSYYYRNKTQPTLSNPADSYYIRFYCVAGYGATYNNDISINYPATDTQYHSYKGETKTADLGRAVYGGSADIIKGEGSETWEKKVYTGADNEYWVLSKSGDIYRYYVINDNVKQPTGRGVVYSSIGQYSAISNDVGTCFTYYSSGIQRTLIYYIPPQTIQTAEDFRTWLSSNNFDVVYEKATPVDFTFEPVKIDSFPGVNNIWNDCGNTAVEYYKAPTPYARKTATGGIANFSDQRTDLPLTKAIANIAPSIAGKSAVNLYQGKKNLVDGTDFTRGLPSTTIGASIDTITASTRYAYYGIGNGGGNFTVSSVSSDTDYFNTILIYGYTKGVLSVYTNASVNTSKTVDFSSCDYIRLAIGTRSTNYQVPTDLTGYGTIQLEVGSSASAYEQYQAPTTYTAELGETVYGGSVDFVSGEVKKTYGKYTVIGQETGDFLAGTNNNGNRIGIRITGAQTPLYSGGISNIGENKACLASSTWTIGSWCIYTDNKLYFVVPNEYTNFATALQYLLDNNASFAFPLAAPTESAIPGRVISPIEGVNNYWNDAGGDTEIQYFENET